MVSIFNFPWHLSNNCYKLFLFDTVGTLLNISKLHDVSKSLHCHISQSTKSTLNETLITNLFKCYKFSEYKCPMLNIIVLTTSVAAFWIVCSNLRWKMSQSDSFSAHPDDGFFCVLLSAKSKTNFWLNFLLIYSRHVLISPATWNYIKESYWNKKYFSYVIDVLLGSRKILISCSITTSKLQLGTTYNQQLW